MINFLSNLAAKHFVLSLELLELEYIYTKKKKTNHFKNCTFIIIIFLLKSYCGMNLGETRR